MNNEYSNTIFIKKLRTSCIIGVRPEERTQPRDIFIDLELHCTHLAGRKTDDLKDTVDYSALSKKIIATVEPSRFYLIEALAEKIAWICLEDTRVEEAAVRIEKPGAVPAAETLGIEIHVKRNR